jgi:MerR family copper efflux transcriptional regulator
MELRIGELSRRTGVTAQTVRYYERLGLIRPERRTGAGYRLYDDSALGRLRFIRRARAIGMSLDEVGRLLPVAEQGECGPLRHEVLGLLEEKIAESRSQLQELERLKDELLASGIEVVRTGCECNAFPESCRCLPGKQE